YVVKVTIFVSSTLAGAVPTPILTAEIGPEIIRRATTISVIVMLTIFLRVLALIVFIFSYL
ncbi:MAG: hypothetical protein KAJ54_00705, partial [Candidatus Aenigmarchaeota archaeon]|nr:hypothetical protein [Candidatus Aenigmarchaeota archaeon]